MTTHAVDSFDTIKILLARTAEPTKEDAHEIRGALYDVYQRLLRVRAVAPTVDYSDRIWRLLGLVGLPNKSLRKAVTR